MATSPESFKCSICLDFASQPRDYFVSTPGGHVFHNSCIKRLMDAGNRSCPICRELINYHNLTRLYGIEPGIKANNNSSLRNPAVKPDYVFKIVLLGNSSVGKSCLLQRFTTGEFTGNQVATCGSGDVSFRLMEMGGKLIKLNLWDTVGQERFLSLATNCVRKAQGVLLVYDVTDSSSFTKISTWSDFVQDNSLTHTVRVLVGNKSDKEEDQRMVTQAQGKALATTLGLSFFETSAKEANNVEAAFRCLVGEIMEMTVLNPDYDDEQQEGVSIRPGCRLKARPCHSYPDYCSPIDQGGSCC